MDRKPPAWKVQDPAAAIETDPAARRVPHDAGSPMITTTSLAMSTGAMVAIVIGMGIPILVFLFVLKNKKKNP
jgi:hypothetical protein